MSKSFTFKSGELVEEDQIVILNDKEGKVLKILQPRSSEANEYNCFKSGGVLFDFPPPNGLGLVLIVEPHLDEDLVKK